MNGDGGGGDGGDGDGNGGDGDVSRYRPSFFGVWLVNCRSLARAGRSRPTLAYSTRDSMRLLLLPTNLYLSGGPLDPGEGLCAVAHSKLVSHIYNIFSTCLARELA